MTAQEGGGATVGALLTKLAHESGTLVRQEVQLARAEMTEKVATAARNGAFVAAGAALAQVGLFVLLLAVVLALTPVMPMWQAALIVGGIALGIGGTFVVKGLHSLKHVDPVPKETVRSLKADVRWAKEQLR